MAIEPKEGYQVDPNNPGGVIPIANQTIPTAPTALTPPPITGNTTTPSGAIVNATTGALVTPPQGQNAPQGLTMPPTGSVVDLLNMAGQDSSRQGRIDLAKQYGVQGYVDPSGYISGAKNQELSKKYLEVYNKTKGTAIPQSGAEGRMAVNDALQGQQPQQDPQKTFFDEYASMNPIVKTLYDTINQTLSSLNTQGTFKQEYENLIASEGIKGLRTELMNVKNIMRGTEDDIRNEITRAGGSGTESQIQALTAARNKTFLKQATSLSEQIQAKEDYIDHLMQFSQLDRATVEKQVDRKIGLVEKVADLQDKMMTAAKDNYQKIVDTVGYKGLADAFGNDPKQMKLAEQALRLPIGALSNPAFLAQIATKNMATSIQEYEYAKKQGYKGSFTDYQNEDANRKAKAAGLGLTPGQINTTVNSIAGAFDNEPIVKNYNTTQEGFQTISSIGVDTKNPADDIAFIYAFAKIMDPNSVVREGEYNTIQKYAQTWADNFGFTAKRIFSNTNFLSPDAKQKMLNALKPKIDTITKQYKNLQSEYQRQINDAYLGKARTITNYAGGIPTTKTGKLPNGTIVTQNADGSIIDSLGNKYDSNGNKIK